VSEQPNYDLSGVEVPEGHQATWRPGDGDAGPQVSIEPVPADPQPDTSEPTTAAALADHEQRQAEVNDAFAAEHEQQLQAARDAEIESAGEPSNIGTDGKPHFLKIVPKPGVDPEGDHDPDDFDYVCGTCDTTWPCEQAKEIEQRDAESRGEQAPGVVANPTAPGAGQGTS
jgi:hypothetical protein